MIFIGVILTILFVFTSPMALVFPLLIFVYCFREKISVYVKGDAWKFIIVGVIFGLLIEIFAIVQNLPLPASEKALFHPVLIPNLIFAFFYYLVIISMWFIVLRKINFSKTTVLVIAGLFGVVVEQGGLALVALTTGLQGIVIAIFVFFVHGIYPMLAYLVSDNIFSKKRIKPKVWQYLLPFLVLFLGIIILMPINIILRLLLG